MSEDNSNEKNMPKTATVSLYLGLGSLIVLIASVIIGLLVESIGMVSFWGAVTGLAIAAIACALIARSTISKEKLPGMRTANTGLILGIIALGLTIFLRVAIFMFFIPWLGA